MKRLYTTALLAISLAFTAGNASATGLRVEPVLLQMDVPTAAGVFTLHNSEDVEVAVQTRVFRWSQVDGVEHLEPTTDVAASPPIVTLAPGADYTARVVRTSKAPVVGEESYRVWVDQLPDGKRQNESGINLLLRQSIPVFFRARSVSKADVSLSLRLEGGRLLIVGSNKGDERLRIASLTVTDTEGRSESFGKGLVGYVLGRSTMTFIIPHPATGFGGAGGTVSISAETNSGAIHAMAPLQIRP
jgi:fimbrial chaperone protein